MSNEITLFEDSLSAVDRKERTKFRNKMIDIARAYKAAKRARAEGETDKMKRCKNSKAFHSKNLTTFLENKQKKIDEFLKQLEDEEKELRDKAKDANDKYEEEKNHKTPKMITLEEAYKNLVVDYRGRLAFCKDPKPLPELEESEVLAPVEEQKVDWSKVELPEEKEARLLREPAIREDQEKKRQVEREIKDKELERQQEDQKAVQARREANEAWREQDRIKREKLEKQRQQDEAERRALDEKRRKRQELEEALQQESRRYKNESESESEEETISRPGSGGFPPIITTTTAPSVLKGKKTVRRNF